MPNWCTQHIRLSGGRAQLERFASIVNSLPSTAERPDCGFGPMWLGNLVTALGGNWESVPCRGMLHSDPELGASFCCPDSEEDVHLEVTDTEAGSALMFSIVSAWSVPYGLYDFILEEFEGMEIEYEATDEFGNFHVKHGFDDVDFEFSINDRYTFGNSQRDELRTLFKKETGIDIPDSVLDGRDSGPEAEKFHEQWEDWCNNGDGSGEFCEFIVWHRE